MDKILDNLFYNEKLGVGNKTTFIKKVQEKHPEYKTKDISDFIRERGKAEAYKLIING